MLTIIVLGLCMYKNILVSDYILDNIVQLSVSGWLMGTFLALGLYMKAGKAPIANLNIYASTKSKIYNFWQGREINPRIGALDVKLLLIRASLIGTVIILYFYYRRRWRYWGFEERGMKIEYDYNYSLFCS